MNKSPIILSALVSLTLSYPVAAAELAPMQAGTFALGDHTASVYYRDRDGRYEVVTTIAPGPDTEGAPVRFVGTLAMGEQQTISLGAFATTTAPDELVLVHDGEQLIATMGKQEVAQR